MKKPIFSIIGLFAFVFILNSCKLIDKLTQFNVDYSTTFSVPATSTLGLPIDLGGSDVTTNSEQTFNNNNTSGDHIKEIHLSSLKLTITTPGQNFSFLKSATIYIQASGLPKVQVASIDNNTSTSNVIDLSTTSADLKDYVIKPSFTISENVTTKSVTTDAIDIKADAQFLVQGKILK
jgi:hypothetical protein